MPWRYFYSTDESDAALKAILVGQDINSGGALVAGVYEYRVLLDSDIDFVKLANDIRIAKIRAIASPERTTQFGTILPTNYLDATVISAGCNIRDTCDLLPDMMIFLDTMILLNTLFVQRDIEIVGSAALGSVKITLTNNYSKTYNIPVNGSVSDNTMIRLIRDNITMSASQTSATANSNTYDFNVLPYNRNLAVTFDSSASHMDGTTDAILKAAINDGKAGGYGTMHFGSNYSSNPIYIDYGAILTNKTLWLLIYQQGISGHTWEIAISTDNVTYTVLYSAAMALTPGNTSWYKYTGKTFRWIRLNLNLSAGTPAYMRPYEIVVF